VKRLKQCSLSGPVTEGEKERSCSWKNPAIKMEEDHIVNNTSDEKHCVLVKTTIWINVKKVKIDNQETKV
jgi:hypothetical protein